MGSSPHFRYRLTIGGLKYEEDDIGENLSVSATGSSCGLNFGEAVSTSISGSVWTTSEFSFAYNSPIVLSVYIGDNSYLLGVWFLKSCSSTGGIGSFTGSDVIAMAECEYEQPPADYIDGNGGLVTFDRSIYTTAGLIKDGLEELTGMTVNVDSASAGQYDVPTQSGLTMRNALGYIAGVDGKYAIGAFSGQPLPINTTGITDYAGYQINNLQCNYFCPGDFVLTVTADDHSELTVGTASSFLQQLTIRLDDTAIPVLNEDEEYEDYDIICVPGGIYSPETTIELTNPIVACGTVAGIKQDVSNLPVFDTLGMDIGTEFSCSTVRVGGIVNYFSRIVFPGYNATFYATSITHTFGVDGIYAAISGSSKSITNALKSTLLKKIENKVPLDKPLKDVSIGYEGLKFHRNSKSLGSMSVRSDYGITAPEPIQEPTPAKVVDVDDGTTEIFYDNYKIRMTFSEIEGEGGETYTTEVIPL